MASQEHLVGLKKNMKMTENLLSYQKKLMKINPVGFNKNIKISRLGLEHGVWAQTLMVKFQKKKT